MDVHFKIINQGSLALVLPVTETAKSWWTNNVDPECMRSGPFYVGEPRYLQNILEGFAADAA